jgi:orotidine-5'-phosphate decarboxylase
MKFVQKLAAACQRNNSLICVGLDPDPEKMPAGVDLFEFNKTIIDVTKDLVCAYKPNIAFYEAMGAAGLEALKKTCDYVPDHIPVIIDAKRGDIGNTAKAYATSLFEGYGCDAVTVSPYLGRDSLEPFMAYEDKGLFVLCRTSNAGAADFQGLPVKTDDGEKPLYEVVAAKVNEWNAADNLGLVVGATYPAELKAIRRAYPTMPLLIPGVGTQGGKLSDVCTFGVDKKRERTIINVSRQVLYASSGKDWAQASRNAALALWNDTNFYLNPMTLGR